MLAAAGDLRFEAHDRIARLLSEVHAADAAAMPREAADGAADQGADGGADDDPGDEDED